MVLSMVSMFAKKHRIFFRGKKDKWVKEYQGQLLISTGAVQWTMDCSKALNAISGGNKTALKALKKKQVGQPPLHFHACSCG